jgi:hypothetical protein
MSGLYNLMFGTHPAAYALLVGVLDLTQEEIPRLRDVYPERVDGELVVTILTRAGEGYELEVAALRKHPQYIRDLTPEIDGTYRAFHFTFPEHCADIPGMIPEEAVYPDFTTRFNAKIAEMARS